MEARSRRASRRAPPLDDTEACLQAALDERYWEQLAPGFGIGKMHRPPLAGPRRAHAKSIAADMRREGWCRAGRVMPEAFRKRVYSLVRRVREAGWPPLFAFLYDEPWLAGRLPAVEALAGALLGPGFRMLPDVWAYFIPVDPHAHGYRPHRELPGRMLDADGSPLSITIWLPLTDATLDNGCMHVVPEHLEPAHFNARDIAFLYRDDPGAALMHRALALPADAGTALSWNHHVRHWGGFSSARARHPRCSVAFEFLRGDVNPALHPHAVFTEERRPKPPLVFSPGEPLPDLRQRLYILGRQVVRYHDHPDRDDPLYRLALRLLSLGYQRPLRSLLR